ncbi:MAG: hypothetical protein RBS49_08540 [Sphaerochaeta sp.]|nr:hypothetical protein [Sphaerochaeta sp.]
MKRLGVITLLVLSASLPLFSYAELRSELFWRSTSGTITSSSASNTYSGTELDVRVTSSSNWDGGFVLTLFGGAQKALTLIFDGVVQDVSAEKMAWYYGMGTAVLIPLGPYFSSEVNVSYETAWQFLDNAELSLDTLRVGLRMMSHLGDGFLLSLGFEYSRPIWGRLIDRSTDDTQVERFLYDATGLAVSVGVGFQAW